MRKTPVILCLILLVAVSIYAAALRFRAHGGERLLDAIQSIRHGATKEEVAKIMGRKPNIVPAYNLPAWMKEVAPEKEKGEYWHFFMGYPPRILIIYFGEHDKVEFTTWTHT